LALNLDLLLMKDLSMTAAVDTWQPTSNDSSIVANAHHQAIADTYAKVRYQSKPFAQSSPENLAVIATLLGLRPPDFRHARVLELGCSGGGNLIPLAVKYPGIQALGLDISKVEIEYGQEVIKRLGIGNCELKALDIVKASAQITGQFDYIICHGVFSWVPEAVRHAILDVIRDHLSPNGIAYVSYNVYPGWKTREIIRDMMMFHAGTRPSPAEKLQQAKAILEFTKSISPEQSTYGNLLRDEALQISKSEDYYLHHEYLEIENHPMYFRDFMSLAQARNLCFLSEASLPDLTPQRLGKNVQATLDLLAGGNILHTEQYIDFFINRRFRQTLLVRDFEYEKINRGLNPQSMSSFSFRTSLVIDAEFKPTAGQMPMARYKDSTDRDVSVSNAFSRELIQIILEAKPGSIHFENIVSKLQATKPTLACQLGLTPEQAIAKELMSLMLQNTIDLTLDQVIMEPLSTQPKAYDLARVQAQLGQNWVTNLLHQPVGLSLAHCSVLGLLDGTRDVAALQAEILSQLKEGRLKASRDQVRITSETQLAQLSSQLCTHALQDFRQMMLLVA
jgi:methyltransferase-like protein/2-polyprenyl-3-methyl-5-hydroxy-6-metoxy-1,4-benzoquinol methylase